MSNHLAAILYTIHGRKSKVFEYMIEQEVAININYVWLIPISDEKPIDKRKKKS